MPSKKKAEEEKRKMSASNRQSRLRGEKSARNFDQQRARQGKKSSSAEKKPQRGGNPHLRRHPIRIHIYSHIPMHPHKQKTAPPSDAVFANSSQTFHFPLKPLHIWSFCVSQRKPPSPIGSPRSPIRILRVTVPGNREADAPSPAPTTACSLLGWDGCCPSCRASAAHR